MPGTSGAVELTAILWAAPDGGFSAFNLETGTTSEGESQQEALSNLAEATALYLEEFPLPLGERPVVTTFHREIKGGTPGGILRQAGVEAKAFVGALGR